MSSKYAADWINSLLAEEKTIRDPVHGDIVLNLLESSVIDTKMFQRLRRIKQLGTVDLVFPGAEHSRFQHSLGTLYMADLLIKNALKNCPPDKIDEPQKKVFSLIVRLAALLHDLYEFPFSHTLEKEGHVLEKQWKNKELNKMIFGEHSKLFSAILQTIAGLIYRQNHVQKTLVDNQWTEKERDLQAANLAATIIVLVYKILAETNEDLSRISQALFGKEVKIIEIFDERFLGAAGFIVRNTICADLLDYLLRDFQFCGIDKKYDKRFLVYSTLFFNDKKDKTEILFAYSLIDKRGRIKQSVLSSLFDVLELRYSLAEMVHTHRVKNAFSVMVIEALNLHYQLLDEKQRIELQKSMMMNMGDYELLQYLRDANGDSKYVLDYYFEHQNYQEIVLWDKWGNVFNSAALSGEALDSLNDASFRLYVEKTLANWINKRLPQNKQLQYGDILFYVMPDPEDLWKELEANIVYQSGEEHPRTKVGTLKSLSVENVLNPMSPMMSTIVRRIEGQQKLLQQKYCNLWRVSMFLSPKIDFLNDPDYKEVPSEVSDLISKIFRFQGIDAKPTEIDPPIVLHEELTKILSKIKGVDRRSYWTMKELFEFPI
jgi:HD superfamily phosphohydrolase